MKKALLIALAAAVLLAASPALAQQSGGFFVALENKFLKPSNLGNEFTIVDNDFDDDPEGDFRSLEFDNEYSPKIWIGQSFGDSGWAVSYWGFDEETNEFVDADGTTTFWATLTHPEYTGFGFENIGTVQAMGTVEASTIDLVYWHKAAETGRLRVSWYGGVRAASLENHLAVMYEDGFTFEDVIQTNETDAIGMTGGLNGSIRINDSWFVHGNLGFSYLMADVEASNTQNVEFALDPPFTLRREEERAIGILDLGCSLGWWVTENWNLRLGYEYSNWMNASDRLVFTDDVNPATVATRTTDVSWDGFNFGIGIRF